MGVLACVWVSVSVKARARACVAAASADRECLLGTLQRAASRSLAPLRRASARRPGELLAANYVQVDVTHGLACAISK